MHGYKQMSSTKKNIKQNNKKTQKRNNPKETSLGKKHVKNDLHFYSWCLLGSACVPQFCCEDTEDPVACLLCKNEGAQGEGSVFGANILPNCFHCSIPSISEYTAQAYVL